MDKILGLDVGTKKIGVAVGDRESGFTFTRPAWLISSWADAWSLLERLMAHEKVSTIVVGWPMNDDGSIGSQADIVDQFIQQMAARVNIPIVRRDERFSTQAVQREHAGRQLNRGQEDSLAAQLLVESYLQEKHD